MLSECCLFTSVFREHDKNPELFFKLLYMLKADNYCFKIAVMGETYTDVPSK